jgi:mRNA-degrading endonuclease RelE of RelBE toxin-antitoxin system
MTYEVRVSRQAAAYFYRLLDRPVQRAILGRLAQIGDAPYSRGTKPVAGWDQRRTALVTSWRLVFAVDDEAKQVNVSLLRPRNTLFQSSPPGRPRIS